MVKIKTVAKALPPYSRTTADIVPMLDFWLMDQDERFRRKVKKIFSNAGVDHRYSIIDAPNVFSKRSFEEKNNLYVEGATKIAETSLRNALEKANWNPKDLDYIITVSCTGFMIPSMDAYLINKLGLRQDVARLPVMGMGCAAGVSGIIYANNFLKANPGKRAAVVAVESPIATFQREDFSMVNVVSAAIFGDGAATVLLSSEEDESGPTILSEEMYHFYDAQHMMGFALKDAGLHMILDIEVPDKITRLHPT